jgi:hypothetical protein
MFPALIEELGPVAEGLTGMAPALDPMSGFAEAYQSRFGVSPPPYAANGYDAVLLLGYALQRSGGEGGDALADAIPAVTQGRGTRTNWDAAGVAAGLKMLRRGESPDIWGSTGDLGFDERARIDLASSYFALWRVEGGAFRSIDFVSTNPIANRDSVAADAVFRELASERREDQLGVTLDASVRPARTGLWALIVATSGGWSNYRHQADALAQYQLLRRAGVPDDRIILIVADDLAHAPENPSPGTVQQSEGGPNLYDAVSIDYDLDDLNADDVVDILAGRRSERLPEVIDSTAGDNVYVFISGHGSAQGLFVGVDEEAERVPEDSFISPARFADTIADMDAHARYRRLLIVLEACHAGVMAEELTAPGALVITGANAVENSLATRYSPNLDVWLGDQFAVAMSDFASRAPLATLGQLYRDVYLDVAGSHVSVYNAAHFGSLDFASLSEFMTP